MTTQIERISIVETKIINLDEKIDDLKVNIKDMHDCLDNTRDLISDKLEDMSSKQEQTHSQLLDQITRLEKFKTKWIYLTAGAVAAFGWITAHADTLIKLI